MKKGIIIGVILIILGIGVILFANNSSYAINNNSISVSMEIDCNSETLKPGESTSCTLRSNLSNIDTTAIYSNMISLNDNLELVSIEKLSNWEGTINNNDENIQLYSLNEQSNFGIVTFNIKAKDTITTSASGNINFTNIKIYKTDSDEYVNTSVSKRITIRPENITEDPENKGSSNTLSKLEVVGQNNSYVINNEFEPTTLEFFVTEDTKTLQINADLSDSTANFVEGYGPRTVDITNQTEFELRVQSVTGDTSTYTIKINKTAVSASQTPENNNANLNNTSSNINISSQTNSNGNQVVEVADTAAFSSKTILIAGIIIVIIGVGFITYAIIKNKRGNKE